MKKLFQKLKSHSLQELIAEYTWLAGYSLQHKGAVLGYTLIGLVGIAVSLLGSIVSKHIIDAVTGYDSKGIAVALVFFVLMELSQIIFRAISGHVSAKISIQVKQEISTQVYDSLLGTDWESLSAFHSGDLLTRAAEDVQTVSSSVLGWLPDLCTRLVQFFGTLGIIVYYDKTLALLALLSAPITLIMSRYVIKMMHHHNRSMRKLSSDMMVFNEESFQNIQLIKAFDRTETYSRKHRDLQKKYKDTYMEYTRFSIGKSTIMSLVGTVVALICFCWSIYRLWSGHITYGTMTLFLHLSGSLSGAFSALAGLIPGAINAATAAGRIMAITQLPREKRDTNGATADFVKNHAKDALSIEAHGLCYHYEDNTQVLSHAFFTAEGGQIVAFVGSSGEGKTTLLRLLLGIIQPKGGSLKIVAENGQSIDISPDTRRLFSYVPQGNTMFSGTIRENLRLTNPNATEDMLWQALKLACAEEFVAKLPLGLDAPVKEQGGGFSEGQLQRLCIARALLSDAPILLLDEATSALDMDTEKVVLENIMQSRKGRTCIVVTHRPSVLKLSHRIYRIDSDRIEPYEA